jgi:type I restriction enzyme S subunit
MNIKPGYKRTEVAVIPEDWEVLDLEATARVVDSLHQTPIFSEDGYPMVRVTDIKTGDLKLAGTLKVSKAIYEEFVRNYKPKRGDIVLSRVGSYGVSSFVETDEPFCMGQNTVVLQPKLPARFLYYALNSCSIRQQIEDGSYGSGYKSLSLKNIKELRITCPSTEPELGAIATALSDVDALASALDRLIAKKRDLKQAAMQQLLTGQTRLPGFHGEWEVKRLGKLAEIVSGGTPKTTDPSYWNGGIKWCTPTDITGCTGKYLRETERTLSRLGLHSSGARLLPAGTLLLCSRATIGEVRIASGEICTNQGFKSLICTEEVSNEFLYYKLLTLKQKMLERAFGSTFLEISKGNLAAIEVNMPLLPEQTAIAAVFSDIDAELSALVARRDKTRNLKQAMMQELLTGKTRLVTTRDAHV